MNTVAQIKPEPREYWIIFSKTGTAPVIRRHAEHANAQRIVFDHDYPNSAPHYVVRVVEA